MKKLTYLLFIIFVSYTIAPTIISVVSKKYDISQFFNITEEEEQSEEEQTNSIKDKFITYSFDSFDIIILNSLIKNDILSDEFLNCNYISKIIIPPPRNI